MPCEVSYLNLTFLVKLWVLSGVVAGVFAAFSAFPGTAAAEGELPNDPHYDKQYYLQQISVPKAWEYIKARGQPLKPVTVAVVDTGVDLSHPDLQGRLTEGTNILQPKRPPQDDNGHGTAVAGVIAALSDNERGIAGIAPNAIIMPVKAVGEKGVGEEEHLGLGIRYAVDNGADIIVLSLGLHLYSPYLSDIVQYAESKGVLLVAATGNEGKTVRYPAAYPTVVAVGGASLTNEYKPLSNYGPEVDILAPWYVFTTGLKGNYIHKEGTSMAAPQVAAVAALMLGMDDTLTPGDIRERLRQSAQPIGRQWNMRTGYGLLRADEALSIQPKPDMYEPNNSKAEAKPVSVASVIRGELSSSADIDWFELAPPYKGEISVQVRSRSGSPLDVEMLVDQGANREPRRVDLSSGEAVRLPSPDGQPVFAGLRMRPRAAGEAAMAYEMETGFMIYHDPYEPNDKAYEAYSLPVRAEHKITGTFSKVDDQDWYRMKFDTPGTLSLRLETDTWRIDPEIYIVRDGESNGTVYDSYDQGDPEYTGDIAIRPGTYYIRVRNVKALFPLPVAGEYTLTIHFQKKFFDEFEPNNYPYQATTMTDGVTYKGVFDSVKDEDWFQFRLSRRSLVSMDITGIPLDRYMYFALFTSANQQKFSRQSSFGTTTMRIEQELEPGVYYIRLMTDAAFQHQQYGLSLKRSPLIAGFTDIEQHWARDSVIQLVNKGIVAGYGDYQFQPNNQITRAEAVVFMTRAFQLRAGNRVQDFSDLSASHWARFDVLAAASRGIVRGYPDGTFRPNDPVTRAEMAAMAAAAAGIAGKTSSAAAFVDLPANHWASSYIHAFVANGQLNGYPDGTFRPNEKATRAQFAVFLSNLLK